MCVTYLRRTLPIHPGALQDIESSFRNESIACVVLAGSNRTETHRPVELRYPVAIAAFRLGGLEPVVIGQGGEGGPSAAVSRISHSESRTCLVSPGDHSRCVDAPGSIKNAIPVEETLMLLASELITTGICAVVTRQAPNGTTGVDRLSHQVRLRASTNPAIWIWLPRRLVRCRDG